MSEPAFPGKFSLALVVAIETGPATHSLADAARLAGVHPERLRYYCRLGLFGDARTGPDGETAFDDDMLYELRRFEHFRREHGLDRKTLRLLCGLWREVERLRAEVRFLRRP